jgi:large subunit ribosomal protein L9
MKVILLKELKGRGGEGDVVDVAQGFAVNYLLPQGIAIQATKGELKQLEQRRHNIEARELSRTTDADTLKGALDGKTLKVLAKVGEEGQLFGSITTTKIAEAITEQIGVTINRKNIDLTKAIKTAGEHEISVTIYRDVKAILTVLVVADAIDLEIVDEVVVEKTGETSEAEEITEVVEVVEEAK